MKKFILLLIALMLLTACGNNSGGGESQGGKSQDSQTIIIGSSGPLSGGAAIYGNAVKNAAEIAVEEINAKGGQQYQLLFEDDEADGEKAVSAFNALMDKGMHISMSCVTSGAAAAVSPLYKEANIFALTPSASSTAVTLANTNDEYSYFGNVFQMCFSDPNQGTGAAQYIFDNKLGEKIAVIYQSDEAYSVGNYENFMTKANELGLNVVNVSSFDTSSAQDFNVQLTQAKDAGADLVFIPFYYSEISLLLAQADAMAYEPVFFAVDGLDGILTLDGFDKSLAEGVYLLTPFSADSTDAKTQSFVKKYQEKFGEIPNQFAADAYDVIYALAQAVENAGITPDMSTGDICDAMINEFTSMSFSGITGESTWSKNGEVSKSPMAAVIKDGVYVGAK